MKTSLLLAGLLAGLLALPLLARADRNPDFDEDAKPILRQQPGLIQYVHSHFEVRDTGQARVPGDEDHRPQPPYIFSARPRGSDGPYNLRLLIQPGPVNRILNVVDITRVHFNAPGEAPAPEPVVQQPAPAPTPAPQPMPSTVGAAPSSDTSSNPGAGPATPTADTPSGPINSSGGTTPSLEPPPDPSPGH
jgi:hypothetical protein